ncbi:MAG: hypothetical protein BGN92_04125 [Sphingobacteriales bacterium 41-5]|nr:MAG: hypothetical protein BGN92_04125 [Sphingobacteriales bacterium 41-5]
MPEKIFAAWLLCILNKNYGICGEDIDIRYKRQSKNRLKFFIHKLSLFIVFMGCKYEIKKQKS